LEWPILDKIKEQIEELKSKIPFLNKFAKNKNEDDEEGAEESSEEELEEEAEQEDGESDAAADMPAWKSKLLEQLPFLAKFLNPQGAKTTSSSASSSDDKTDPNIKIPDAADKKKKLIRFAIIGAIGLYIVLDLMSGGDKTDEQAPVVEGEAVDAPRPKRKRDRPNPEAPSEAQPQPETQPDPIPEPQVESQPEPQPEPVLDQGSIDSSSSGDLVVEGLENVDLAPVDEGTAPDVPDDIDPDLKAQDNDDIFKLNPEGESSGGDQVSETPGGETSDMTEQILQDLEKQVQSKQDTIPGVSNEYVAPPEYEYVGRGLVYNCKGKHWACIDAPSFKVCQQNHNALKSQSRSKECVPDSVYETDSACVWVQKKKITSNTKTDFCN